MRNQKLRDSLFVKFDHPEFAGRNLFWNRFFHNVGEAPVIYSDAKTKQSAKSINNRLINRGYWDAEVKTNVKRDSASKKAEVEYVITHKDPTYIKDYYYKINDQNVRAVYESQFHKSFVKKGQILDEGSLEKEITRINNQMKDEGYYKFNNENQDIYFVADSLHGRKNVPLVMNVSRDSLDTPYRKSTIGKVTVSVARSLNNVNKLPLKDSLRGINILRKDSAYTLNSLWLPIILK